MMRGNHGRWVVSTLAGLMVVATPAVAQVIDFDDAQDGEVINNRYVGQGVTFTCVNCVLPDGPEGNGETEVIAREAQDFTPPSAPNVVAPFNKSGGDGCYAANEDGIIRATFSPTVNTVSIRVITDDDPPEDGDTGFLRAYNSSDQLVDEAFSQLLIGNGNNEVIAVSGDISYVEFAGVDTEDVCIDDLAFGAGVPTMSSLWILILTGFLALASLYALRQRLPNS